MSERREAILRIAAEAFAEQGVQATTVRDLGSRAGILSGSLYHHFGSKLDIVDALMTQFCDGIIEPYREIAAADLDPETRVRHLIRHGFSMIVHHKAAVIMVQSDAHYFRTLDRFAYLEDTANEVQRIWIEAVREGVDTGVFRSDLDPLIFYRMVYDVIAGAVRWFDPDKSMTIEQLASEASDILLLGARRGGAAEPRAGEG